MQPKWVSLMAVVLLISFAPPGSAGVYSVGEKGLDPAFQPGPDKPLPYERFSLALDDVMELTDTVRNTDRRKQALERRNVLRAKVNADPENVDNRLNLSAYYIRLGDESQPEPHKAVQLLEGIARTTGRNNFMVLANLATAYQMMGDPQSLQRADDYLQTALAVWPKEWPDISKEQLDWYKDCEKAQLKLLRTRRKELAAQGGKSQPPETVDDLFGVKFVGEDGQYQAGTIAAAEKAKLPKDAVAIIQQLMLWIPQDGRLYWQLGELLNAQGDINSAKIILDQCSDSRRINALELRQHRQVLEEELAARAKAAGSQSASWLPDQTRLVAIGGGVGLIVLLLLALQARELIRRWRLFS